MNFQSKSVIVTGGARGIGRGIALEFAKHGAKVLIADILSDEANKAVAEIQRLGGKVVFVRTDATKMSDVQNAVNICLRDFGNVDVLVNNIGWSQHVLFKDMTEEFWDKMIDLNYKAMLRFCKAVLNPMIERKYGKIVNIGSDAGRVGSSAESVYSGCKGGVIAFTKTLARELARYSICVNCVCPGPTETPATDQLRKEELGSKIMSGLDKAIPLRRWGKPSDIAAAVLFFASNEAEYVTGQTLSVSGGLTMV